MTTETMPCPYDTRIEDRDPPSIRRALGELRDWWDVQVLASPAQMAAADTVVATVSGWRRFAGRHFQSFEIEYMTDVSNELLDAVELARRTLHVVCAGRP